MSPLAESLKRLYPTSQVVRERVEGMRLEGKITQEEYDYIIA